MIKLAFVFRSPPYGSASTREGLDALLAASAFCAEDEIALYFLDDGVFNLCANQQAELLLQKDVASALKLLDLYDIEQRYVCQQSLQKVGLSAEQLGLSCQTLSRADIIAQLRSVPKILTF